VQIADDIRLEVLIRCPADRTWTAFAEGKDTWWPSMEFAAVPGTPVRERWEIEGIVLTAEGEVDVVVPGRRLTFRWSEPGWEAQTTVTFTFHADDGGTRVALVESGFAALSDGGPLAAEHVAGWAGHLRRLKRHAEAGLQ
jgi:uncharacterized protein YndB with AHSA1/START domain